ncbi:MAG: glycosyltransferase [Candidatus Aminicenantes bacterium]|nr:MAG: glycosyltransferase [Candidatus Aminicenantes bacterium]
MTQKRILLCSYPFAPAGGPQSLRWLNLVKILSERGWQVDVLAAKPSIHDSFYDESLLKELPSDVTVFRTYPGIYYSLKHIKKRPVRGFSKATVEWFPFGVQRGNKLVKSQKYDAIISSGLPFVAHLVGYFLKRKGQLTWIADYGDPFGFNPMTSKVKRLIGRSIEQHILKKVDGVVVPLEEMRKQFLEFYPFLKKALTKEIGNGIPDMFQQIKPAHSSGKFVISYVGSFYKGDREPTQFFEALNMLKGNQKIMDNIEVIFAGNTEQRYIDYAHQLKINDLIQFLGRISYEKSVSILKGSSVILFIGSTWDYYHFQYKTAEYAASGRPIMAIRQSPTDCGIDFIEKHKLGLVVSNDKEEMARAIDRLFTLWNNNALESSFGRFPKETFYWQTRAKEWEEFLLSIMSRD